MVLAAPGKQERLARLRAAIEGMGDLLHRPPSEWESDFRRRFGVFRRCCVHLRAAAFSLEPGQAKLVDEFLARLRGWQVFREQVKEVRHCLALGAISEAEAEEAEAGALARALAEEAEAEAGVIEELRAATEMLTQAAGAAGAPDPEAEIERICARVQRYWSLQRRCLLQELRAAMQEEHREFRTRLLQGGCASAAAAATAGASAAPAPDSAWEARVADWHERDNAAAEDAFRLAADARSTQGSCQQALHKAKLEAQKKEAATQRAAGRAKRRQDEAVQTPQERHVTHQQAEEAAKTVQGGGPDLAALADMTMGGNHVWVWEEDTERWAHQSAELRRYGSQTFPVVLYLQKDWAMVEAQYLCFTQSRDPKYRYITLSVQKLFHHHTGDQYKLDLQTLMQNNVQTGYARQLRRIDVHNDLRALCADDASRFETGVAEQRQKAAEEAAEAAQRAKLELNKAAEGERSAQARAKQAATLVKGLDTLQWILPLPQGERLGLPGYKVPLGWSDMGTCTYLEVDLAKQAGCEEERQKVVHFFYKTSPAITIRAVTRIQSLALWKLYVAARGRVASSGAANEDLLWHGASLPGVTGKIMTAGFDLRFAESHPRGVWLSTNSQYSVTYSQGDMKMLLVRTILGNIGVDSLHMGGTSQGHTRRDDQTGGGADNRYVIQDACQCYPAYVVDFA